MIPMRLDEIAAVVDGEVHGDGSRVVAGATYVDSREPVRDGLFLAVVGDRVDGHDYADGAHAVLGSRPTSAPTVVVGDPVAALGRLARHVLEQIGATVLALTGSQGKTGTKDYLAGILGVLVGEDRVVATTANHNNEIGVPLTVLSAEERTTHLVVEMGARGVGHISYLCQVAPPRLAAVLNIGTAHVGEFGGREAIATAKGEIVAALPDDGVAVLNADDPLSAALAGRTRARSVTFGITGDVAWRDLVLDERARPAFELGYAGAWRPVRLRQSGAHQAANAAAAAAFALELGHPLAAVAEALSRPLPTSRWRMEVHERSDGLIVLNDSYNANPESMHAALEALVAMGGAGRRRMVAVLGEMRELGDEHVSAHRALGGAAVDHRLDVLVVVGDGAAPIADSVTESGRPAPEVVRVAGPGDAVTWLRHNAGPEDVVLLKASRGVGLERVAAELLATESGGGSELC